MPICYLLRWVLRCGELTNNALVSSRQSLPAWTAIWMEARAAHIGSDREKNKETHYLLLPAHFSTSLNKHTHISSFLRSPEPARSLLSEKQTLIWKHCKVMDWGILRLGRREMQEAFSSVFCFPSMLISKLGKTGCAESSSLSQRYARPPWFLAQTLLVVGSDP